LRIVEWRKNTRRRSHTHRDQYKRVGWHYTHFCKRWP
jgi:hypothetical protein